MSRAPAPMPAQLLVTGIDEEPMEPWAEAFRIAQPREFAPGEEECLLDGVLRPLRIAQDPIRDRVAQVAVEVDELREGDVVALACPFDQPRPHGRYSSGARSGASPTTDGRSRGKVHARRTVRRRNRTTEAAVGTTEAYPQSRAAATIPTWIDPPDRHAATVVLTLLVAVMLTPGVDGAVSRLQSRGQKHSNQPAPTLPGAPGCPVFPGTTSGTPGSTAGPSPANSATMISTIGLDRGLHMDFGSYAGYGIPYQVVTGATPRSTVAFDYDDESDHVGYPIPASPLIEGGSDRHMLHGRPRRVPAVRAVRRAQGRRALGRRERRDLGPALERAAAGRLDQRRCRRPADPARPRPLRRGRRRR